ncbi:GntR family transcriptional regulator, partial [Methylobacterium sp. WL93]|uniref:GntR family transcriptional regulator n=1 Tax=Methylobacterium sp. WL93 TaxID=2603892 RepID=UPI001FEF1232
MRKDPERETAGASPPGDASALPLVLDLAPGGALPLQARIGDALRRAILERRIARGARLPGSRALAEDLGCARGTVLAALEQLVAEGYLTAHGGSGTRVAAILPDDTLAVASPPQAAGSFPAPPVLSRRGTALMASSARAWFSAPVAPDAFALGRPAADAFPFATFGRLLQTEWRDGARRSRT